MEESGGHGLTIPKFRKAPEGASCELFFWGGARHVPRSPPFVLLNTKQSMPTQPPPRTHYAIKMVVDWWYTLSISPLGFCRSFAGFNYTYIRAQRP